jgi:leucine-rich repeat protein SHOC2
VLPSEIGDLAELEALYLTQNALTGLPRSVGRLRRLRKLQAASNRLEALPDELALLPVLVRFYSGVE